MADVIESADQLFDLLAGDDEEVPSTLLRGNKKSSRHDEALVEQAHMAKLNKVEKWMKSDKAVESDPQEFLSLGETLIEGLLRSKITGLSTSIVQKLVKLSLLWLKVTKSCKLIEQTLSSDSVNGLIDQLIRSKSPAAPIQDVATRMLLGMVQCSPSRLFHDRHVIAAFNKFIVSWCKGKFKGNGFTLLNMFPIEFLEQLTWPPSRKPFIGTKVHDLIVRLLKKSKRPIVNQTDFVNTVTWCQSKHKKELEEGLVKLAGALVRSRTRMQISPELLTWIQQVSQRDTKQEGVSVKNVRMAAEVLKQIANH
jgi:hypothetical protein